MNQRKLFLTKAVLTLMMTILTMVTSVLVLSVVSAQEQSAPAGEMFATRPRIDVPVSLPLEEARVIIDAAVAFSERGRRPGGHRGGRLQRQPDFDGLHGWQLEILGALRRRQGGGRGGAPSRHRRVGGAGQNKPRALPKRVEHVGGRNPPDSRRHTADHQ